MCESQSTPSCVEVVVAVVHLSGKILIAQRREDADHLPDYWEFPGGKREEGETIEDCLARELLEELDVRATPIVDLAVIEFTYPGRRVRLIPKLCEFIGGDPKPLACQQFAWVEPAQLRSYRFPSANDQLIEEILNYFQPTDAGGRTPPLI